MCFTKTCYILQELKEEDFTHKVTEVSICLCVCIRVFFLKNISATKHFSWCPVIKNNYQIMLSYSFSKDEYILFQLKTEQISCWKSCLAVKTD